MEVLWWFATIILANLTNHQSAAWFSRILDICLNPSWNLQTLIFLPNILFALGINSLLGAFLTIHNELKHKPEIRRWCARLITCMFMFALLDAFDCSDNLLVGSTVMNFPCTEEIYLCLEFSSPEFALTACLYIDGCSVWAWVDVKYLSQRVEIKLSIYVKLPPEFWVSVGFF